MVAYKRDDILNDLKSNVLEVVFQKVNGDQRVMRCTLDPIFLPVHEPAILEEMQQRPENLDVIAVWDLQAQGWRAFRVDSVSYLQVLDNY